MSEKVVDFHTGEKLASPGDPDLKLVAELEDLLQRARDGEIVGIGYAIGYGDRSQGNRYVGTISRGMVGGMFACMSRMSRELDAC